jgi:hypothetical protein
LFGDATVGFVVFLLLPCGCFYFFLLIFFLEGLADSVEKIMFTVLRHWLVVMELQMELEQVPSSTIPSG